MSYVTTDRDSIYRDRTTRVHRMRDSFLPIHSTDPRRYVTRGDASRRDATPSVTALLCFGHSFLFRRVGLLHKLCFRSRRDRGIDRISAKNFYNVSETRLQGYNKDKAGRRGPVWPPGLCGWKLESRPFESRIAKRRGTPANFRDGREIMMIFIPNEISRAPPVLQE